DQGRDSKTLKTTFCTHRRTMSDSVTAEESEQVERSEAAASAAVLEARPDVVEAADHELVPQIVTEELVDEVFRLAWRHQFDDNRRAIRSRLRELVADRVAELLLPPEDN